MDKLPLKCVSCKSYMLEMPEHGNRDLPYYVCKENKTPDKCEKYEKEEKHEKH